MGRQRRRPACLPSSSMRHHGRHRPAVQHRAAEHAWLREDVSVAQVGVEPTASLVLSQGGLPVAYRAMRVQCPVQESNLQSLGFKPSRSADWRIRARVVPDGLEPPLAWIWPGVVAAGPRDYRFRAEAARLELATVLPASVFKTGSSPGRMTSVLRV